jgi:hypothetical protein
MLHLLFVALPAVIVVNVVAVIAIAAKLKRNLGRVWEP